MNGTTESRSRHELIAFLRVMTGAYSAKAVAKDPCLKPLELLKRADLMSREFAPGERAAILQDLAAVAADIQPSQAKGWANQLLHISYELPLGHFRASIQKETLCTIAKIDATRAASLWRLQDAPRVWTNGNVLREDLRSDGTAVLFPALWEQNQSKSIVTIQFIADWLGRTGQYPYGPVAEVMRKLIAIDRDAVESFYAAGIHYLPTGQEFETTNRYFVSFILNTKNLVRRGPLRRALAAAVLALESATRASKIETPKRSCDSPMEVLLSELLPTIRDVDASLALRLIEKYPSLLDARNSAPHQVLTLVEPSPGDEFAATEESMDESRLCQVQALATKDRKQAAQVALAICDSALQSAALAALAPIFVEGSEEEIFSWINSVTQCLEKITPAAPKLRLLVTLCDNYLSRERFAEGVTTMHQAFSLGELLFDRHMQANAGSMSHTADAFDSLSDLVGMAAIKLPSPGSLMNAIGCIRNELLKARMLIIAAAALSNRRG